MLSDHLQNDGIVSKFQTLPCNERGDEVTQSEHRVLARLLCTPELLEVAPKKRRCPDEPQSGRHQLHSHTGGQIKY
ncbi:hypothetical protein AV530_000674 [Patagioenas fasciata monilis]|uniref:Uncharacterized protein n=1 Tax=Patagioenas fasciata monilis TaxID=372326 RepID=A0A1V4IGB2_PATFA|nr:hypothetical protein AV530_000674 [Patagioenas fasciata monilis]